MIIIHRKIILLSYACMLLRVNVIFIELFADYSKKLLPIMQNCAILCSTSFLTSEKHQLKVTYR